MKLSAWVAIFTACYIKAIISSKSGIFNQFFEEHLKKKGEPYDGYQGKSQIDGRVNGVYFPSIIFV